MVAEPEDVEMDEVPVVPMRIGRPKGKKRHRDSGVSSQVLADNLVLGSKQSLQCSPSRTDSVAKRTRSTQSPTQKLPVVPKLQLKGQEVTEDDEVDLGMIPELAGKVRDGRYQREFA